MSQGKGLGLADMLVQQLTRNRATKLADGAQSAAGASGTSGASKATPASSTTSGTTGAATPAKRISFVKMMQPYAEQAAGQLGVSPDTLIAQAALETGWGQHVPASGGGSSSLNLFGVKAGAGFRGEAVTALTTEYDGRGSNPTSMAQPFRAYASVQQGINDYVTLLQRNYEPGARQRRQRACLWQRARARRVCHRPGLCPEIAGHRGQCPGLAQCGGYRAAQESCASADNCPRGSFMSEGAP